MTMVSSVIPIPTAACQNGISSMPTRRNIIIGVKNGINEVTVINPASGAFKPNIAIIKPHDNQKRHRRDRLLHVLYSADDTAEKRGECRVQKVSEQKENDSIDDSGCRYVGQIKESADR